MNTRRDKAGAIGSGHSFGSRRVYYNNFAEHLQNAYNPNMFYPGLPNRWTDGDWLAFIDMIAGFGFNVFEFWLVPVLFSREGLASAFGREFTRQMNLIVDHAHSRGMKAELLCGLATVGAKWHTHCPNVPEEWSEVRFLWDAWTRRLPGVDIIGIFPGDPGACSRNGCTAETYIDKSIEISHLVKGNLPAAEIEFGTWGPPFFGWGNIKGPPGWKGEFIPEYQASAWEFDAKRAEASMRHLLKRLPDFPEPTSVAINMGFNGDGNPVGDRDARPWVREIARTHRVYTWDFSLTEGENNIVPHWRFDRLFGRRREEHAVGVYSGGICYTSTPLLNQLSLYVAAPSFLHPEGSGPALAQDFYERLFGPEGRRLADWLRLFEVVRDWGNYTDIDLSRQAYHAEMKRLDLFLRGLKARAESDFPFHPSPEAHRQELLFFAGLFAELSGPSPDYAALRKRYWDRVYAIYDHLPTHVDPRPAGATDALIRRFAEWKDAPPPAPKREAWVG